MRCEALAPDGLCNAYRQLFDCAGDAIAGSGAGSASGDPLARCGQIVKDEVVGAWSDYGEKIRSFGSFLRRAAPRLARGLGVGNAPAQQILDRNAAAQQVIGLNKTLRTAEQLAEDAREIYESMRDASKALTEDYPDLITEAKSAAAADGVDDDEREAFFNLLEDADYHQSDAVAIEELEPVYTGDADVVETLGAGATDGGGSSGGATCGADYEEFPVDDKTSTCVWSSLVEWNCYAGSRHVSHPNLGGTNACLYYSLDFFQPDGSCRENYAKVTFQGRETCRWEELGADKAAWYTLEKEHGVASPQTPVDPVDDGDIACQTDEECPTCSCGCNPRYDNDGTYLGRYCSPVGDRVPDSSCRPIRPRAPLGCRRSGSGRCSTRCGTTGPVGMSLLSPTACNGNSPGEAVRVTVPARSARDYMAWELETGSAAGLSGALGDGAGKWRLRVSAPADVEAMSLLGLPTGHVTNLSTTPRHPPE